MLPTEPGINQPFNKLNFIFFEKGRCLTHFPFLFLFSLKGNLTHPLSIDYQQSIVLAILPFSFKEKGTGDELKQKLSTLVGEKEKKTFCRIKSDDMIYWSGIVPCTKARG